MSNYMTIYHLTDEAQTCENIIVEWEGNYVASIFQSYSSPDINEDLVDKIKEIAQYAQNSEFIEVEYMTFDEYEKRNDE